MKFFQWIFKIVIYYISFALPRNKEIWIYYGAYDNFIDNTKYCYLYATQNYKSYKHIWLTNNHKDLSFLRKKNCEAYKLNSLKGIKLMLCAKIFIYDTELKNAFITGGGIRCNLWHGIPLKKIMYDDTIHGLFKKNKIVTKIKKMLSPDSIVLCPSLKLKKIFQSAFRVKETQLVYGMYYRNIPLFMDLNELDKYIKENESEMIKKIYWEIKEFSAKSRIVYMPTFRDHNPYFIQEAIPDFELLNEKCKQNNILFILKLHRHCSIQVNFNSFSNIIELDPRIDIYPLLPFTDILITDYSSIFFDYALMENKRIIYYPFDLEEYQKKNRELYFNYNEIVGDDICFNFNNLLSRLTISNQLNKNIGVSFYDNIDFKSLFNKIIISTK